MGMPALVYRYYFRAHSVKSLERNILGFVGIAPISDPRLVVAVMIDEPTAGGHYGGDVAGPVFSAITGGALRTLGVPPDAPIQVADASAGKGKL